MGLTNWLYGPQCCDCGTRNHDVKHKEEMGTMGGTIVFWFCNDCYNKKLDKLKKQAEEGAKRIARQIKENQREEYYAWLKREVEIEELERKAASFGMKALKEKYDSGQV